MSGLTDTLTNLPIADDDDFNLAPPETYVDSGIEMLPAGTYDLTITDYTVNTEEVDGKDKATSIDVEMMVVGANDAKYLNRRTGRIRLFTKKFVRKPIVWVSGFGDFVRGITDTERWLGQDAGIDLLGKARDRAIPIQVRLDWEAYDKKGFDAEGGQTMTPKSDEVKQKKSRSPGQTYRRTRSLCQLMAAITPSLAGMTSIQIRYSHMITHLILPDSNSSVRLYTIPQSFLSMLAGSNVLQRIYWGNRISD